MLPHVSRQPLFVGPCEIHFIHKLQILPRESKFVV